MIGEVLMQAKMRVGIVTPHPPGTGTLNEYAFHFVRYLRRKADVSEVILFCDDLPDGHHYNFDKHGAPVTVVPSWSFDAWGNALRLRNAVMAAKPDVLLFNIQFASFGRKKAPAALGLVTPLITRLGGIPTMVLLHNIMETVDLKSAGFGSNKLVEWSIRTFGKIVTHLLLQADVVALTIPKYVELLRRDYGADNVLLAPHGSFEDSAPQPSVEPPKETDNGTMQIMTFGKFGTYKRVETLIEAFAQLQAPDQNRPPLELVIAGTDSPNAAGYLAQMAQRYAHVPNVRYTGYVSESDVPVIFNNASVVVFPYTSTTGSSGVLHQAGDYGKAVVLPNIGDFAEVIREEGYTGEFFQPNDINSMAQAIARVIDDAANRQAIGLQNYRAARGLPMEEVVDWYVFHFETMLQTKLSRNDAQRTNTGVTRTT